MARKLILAAPVAVLVLPASAEAGTARAALDEALALFAPAPPRVARDGANEEREATLVLRELAMHLSELTPRERRLAERLLARPTSPRALNRYVLVARRACDRHICVWWSTSGRDAPPPADSDRDGVPNQVERTQKVLRTVWRREIGDFGYLPPLPDGSGRCPDERLDVYLTDVGQHGLYGYCASDDPRLGNAKARRVWSYCVFDNDFRAGQYAPSASGREGAAGHRRPRVLPRRAIPVRLSRGPVPAREHSGMDGGRGLRRGQRQPRLAGDGATHAREHGVDRPLASARRLHLRPERSPVRAQLRLVDLRPLPLRANRPQDRARDLGARAEADVHPSDRRGCERSRPRLPEALRGVRGVEHGSGSVLLRRCGSIPLPGTAALPLATAVPWDMLHLSNNYLEVPVAGSGTTTLTLSLDFPAPEQPGLPEANVVVFDATGVHRYEIALDPAGNAAATVPVAGATRAVLVITNAGSDTICGQGTFFACGGASLDDVLDGYLVTATLS